MASSNGSNSEAETLHEVGHTSQYENIVPKLRGFLDLPDELLEHILRDVHDDLKVGVKARAARGLRVSLDQAMITKRVYALALPFWWSAINATVSSDNQSIFLARLSASSTKHSHITQLRLHLPTTSPVLALTALLPLAQLESLHIEIGASAAYTDSFDNIAATLSLLLTSSTRLQTLAVLDSGRLPAASPEQATLPNLRHLHGYAAPWFGSMLRMNKRSLQTVSIDGPFSFAADFLAWDKLVKLDGRGLTSTDWPMNLTNNMRTCISYPAKTALRQLCISFVNRFGTISGDRWNNWFHWLFHVLQSTKLASLHISDFDSITWPATDVKLSLTVLRLSGSCKIYQGDTLEHLRSFLATFPAVRKLVIEHCPFSAAMETATTPDFVRPLDTATLAMRIPHLAAFVVFLETTSVLEFRYAGKLDEYIVRWRRHSRSDPLVRDAVL